MLETLPHAAYREELRKEFAQKHHEWQQANRHITDEMLERSSTRAEVQEKRRYRLEKEAEKRAAAAAAPVAASPPAVDAMEHVGAIEVGTEVALLAEAVGVAGSKEAAPVAVLE